MTHRLWCWEQSDYFCFCVVLCRWRQVVTQCYRIHGCTGVVEVTKDFTPMPGYINVVQVNCKSLEQLRSNEIPSAYSLRKRCSWWFCVGLLTFRERFCWKMFWIRISLSLGLIRHAILMYPSNQQHNHSIYIYIYVRSKFLGLVRTINSEMNIATYFSYFWTNIF